MAVYPYEKTSPIVLRVIDDVTSIDSALFLKYAQAILRLENELGIKPSGTYSDVRTRLDAMELGTGDGYTGGPPHSVHIATHFRHNWLSPTIITPLGPAIMPTVIGQVPVNPPFEAGYDDGYGVSCFINRFFVDNDASFTLQLWETTSTPTLVYSNTYVAGEHTELVIVSLPFVVSLLRNYELRCYQVASGGTTNTNSIIWNSRLLFVPFTASTPVAIATSYITVNFNFSEVPSKVIGNIPALGAVQNVALIIDAPFDGGTTISVGDAADNTRLMDTTENTPGVADTYLSDPNYVYAIGSQIEIYFVGAPTVGSGSVIVYFH